MIVTFRMAAIAGRMPPMLRPLLALSLLLAAAIAPLSTAYAQASAPQGAEVPVKRDFEGERKAIGDARAWTNYRFALAERECYSKFLVNRCIEKAQDEQRAELHVLRKRELDVGDAERAYKAATRDREQAIRRAEYEAGQPGRAANEAASRAAYDRKQQEQQLRDAQRAADAPSRAANAQAFQQKQADFDARVKEAQQKGAEQARQRQENVKAFEEKQRQAAERQKALDERRENAKQKQNPGGSTPSPFGF